METQNLPPSKLGVCNNPSHFSTCRVHFWKHHNRCCCNVKLTGSISDCLVGWLVSNDWLNFLLRFGNSHVVEQCAILGDEMWTLPSHWADPAMPLGMWNCSHPSTHSFIKPFANKETNIHTSSKSEIKSKFFEECQNSQKFEIGSRASLYRIMKVTVFINFSFVVKTSHAISKVLVYHQFIRLKFSRKNLKPYCNMKSNFYRNVPHFYLA